MVNHPTRPGQLVTDENNRLGITTDFPRIRTQRISVQFVGANYPVLEQVEDLTVREEAHA